MRLDLAELAGVAILSGGPSGRQLYATLIEKLPADPDQPEVLFLDFCKIQVATASYLRESILEFRNFVRGRRSNFYPVVANASPDILDEIIELVQSRSDVMMTCQTDKDGQVLSSRHVGKLDPMQRLTFDLVNSERETTAAKLMEMQKSDVKATAWNNRLTALASLGLISEHSKGRSKTYSPLFSGGSNGR